MWFHRWIFVDAWVPVWPNLLAGIIGWCAGLFVADRRIKSHLHRHHEEIKNAIRVSSQSEAPEKEG